MKKILKQYHKNVLRYLRHRTTGAIFLDMRLRKTLMMIRHVKLLGSKIKKVLVVGPYSVLHGWEELLTEENEGVTYLNGNTKKKKEQLSTSKKWVLFNKEGHLHLPEIADVKYDCIILDESTFIKNPQSQVTKFYLKRFLNVPYRYILTGTPALESELDYYCQLRFLDVSILECGNYYEFRHKYFKRSGFGWTISAKGKTLLSQRLAKHCYFLKRADVGITDEKVFIQRYVEMPKELETQYRIFEEEFWCELGNDITVKTAFAGAKFCKLRQLCSGLVQNTLLYKHKIDELLYLMTTELKGKKVVIWCHFVDEIIMIIRELKRKGIHAEGVHGDIKVIKRNEINDKFQKGKLQVIVVQNDVWKMGTTLSISNTAINFSSPVSATTREQVNDRTIDIDKKEPSLIIDIIVKNSVEEDIYASFNRKQSSDARIRSIVQRIKKRTNNRSRA